ncbi:hypothetical protein L5515_012278 [Caenorhabditis briggsae]|uniref:Uncharacterized protein n=1 Tax=Caenorhabditis briggsae TaxID=6238 RepID=A0AAE9EX08_CAEBR|nr:hypothetical protein L5515_012278 [Caenorhabditis briggsae]
MIKFLVGICLGLQVVDGIGGRAEILLESLINSDMKVFDPFKFEYSLFNRNGNFKNSMSNIWTEIPFPSVRNFWRVWEKLMISTMKNYLQAIHFTDLKPSVTSQPLILNTSSGTVYYRLYAAVAKTMNDKNVPHVKSIILWKILGIQFWFQN